jgi:hypothetical protein
MSVEGPDPPVRDAMDRHGIQVVALFPSFPDRRDESGGLEDFQVLSDRLLGYPEPLNQLRLAQPVPTA